MHGRKPRPLWVGRADSSRLEEIAHSLCFPWYQVRRARIVLARAAGERTQNVAQQLQCNVSTVQRTCRRFEDLGLAALLACVHRPGRPAEISLLQRAAIVKLACLEPAAKGLHITHWSSSDLARQAVREGIVP